MDVKIEELGPCKKKLTVEVPAERVTEEFEKSYRTLSTSIDIPGFRRAHAPRWLLEKRFGETLKSDVREALLTTTLEEALKEHSISALGEPKYDDVEFEAGSPLKYDVTLEVKPTFDIPDYKEIEVTRPSTEVTDQEVDEAIESFRKSHGKLVPDDSPVTKEGHYVLANVKLSVEGAQDVQRDGMSIMLSQEAVLGIPVKHLSRKLEGAHVGDTRTFDVEIPADYPVEAMPSKSGSLHVEVKEIQRMDVPELDEKFLESAGFESCESLRERMQQVLRERRTADADTALQAQLTDALLEKLQFDLPQGILKSQADSLLRRRKVEIARRGMPQEEIDKQAKELEEASAEDAERQTRLVFIMDAIASKEGIETEDSDVDARVAAMAARSGVRPQQTHVWLERENLMDDLRNDIRTEKTRRFLRENVTVRQVGNDGATATPDEEVPSGQDESQTKE